MEKRLIVITSLFLIAAQALTQKHSFSPLLTDPPVGEIAQNKIIPFNKDSAYLWISQEGYAFTSGHAPISSSLRFLNIQTMTLGDEINLNLILDNGKKYYRNISCLQIFEENGVLTCIYRKKIKKEIAVYVRLLDKNLQLISEEKKLFNLQNDHDSRFLFSRKFRRDDILQRTDSSFTFIILPYRDNQTIFHLKIFNKQFELAEHYSINLTEPKKTIEILDITQTDKETAYIFTRQYRMGSWLDKSTSTCVLYEVKFMNGVPELKKLTFSLPEGYLNKINHFAQKNKLLAFGHTRQEIDKEVSLDDFYMYEIKLPDFLISDIRNKENEPSLAIKCNLKENSLPKGWYDENCLVTITYTSDSGYIVSAQQAYWIRGFNPAYTNLSGVTENTIGVHSKDNYLFFFGKNNNLISVRTISNNSRFEFVDDFYPAPCNFYVNNQLHVISSVAEGEKAEKRYFLQHQIYTSSGELIGEKRIDVPDHTQEYRTLNYVVTKVSDNVMLIPLVRLNKGLRPTFEKLFMKIEL